jgi:hypothetical protein
MLDSVAAYRRLTGEFPPLMDVFWPRAAVTWAREAIPVVQEFDAVERDRLAAMNRPAFFAWVLPVAHASASGHRGSPSPEP